MQTFVYLIFSHSNVQQTLRLASSICRLSENAVVAIHQDKSQGSLELPKTIDTRRVVVIPNPETVSWGDFSFVEAFLTSTKFLLEHRAFSWLVTLSGADYPIQNLSRFENQLATSGADAFIRHFPVLEHPFWPRGEGRERYFFRYFALPRFALAHRIPKSIRKRFRNVCQRLNGGQGVLKIACAHRNRPAMLGIANRSAVTERMTIYGGMDWFNLNHRSVSEIHRFAEENPWFLDHYRRTLLPSESFVHTILANNRDFSIVNDALRFVNWPADEDAASPVCFGAADFGDLIASGQPFARKFDSTRGCKILDMLDRHLFANA